MMVRRGEIYWVEFDPVKGSEQGGLHPALVVQQDIRKPVQPDHCGSRHHAHVAPAPLSIRCGGGAGRKRTAGPKCHQLFPDRHHSEGRTGFTIATMARRARNTPYWAVECTKDGRGESGAQVQPRAVIVGRAHVLLTLSVVQLT